MDVADLREQVTLQTYDGTSNNYGGSAPAWANLATVWAKVTPVGGSERIAADRVEDVVEYEVTIRYRSDMAAANAAARRLVWRSKTMNIRAIMNRDERREYLTLLCTQGAAT